jgi:hypothetical protein
VDIEGVLAGHELHASMNICLGCDWRPIGDHAALKVQHRAHVAAVLREQIVAAQAEAWDEGWAARAQTRTPFLSAVHLDGNPYRAAQVAPSRVPGEET